MIVLYTMKNKIKKNAKCKGKTKFCLNITYFNAFERRTQTELTPIKITLYKLSSKKS